VRRAADRALAVLGDRSTTRPFRAQDGDPGAPPKGPDTSWFAFYLVDRDDGSPKASVRYWLELPSGFAKAGWTDDRGNAREEHMPEGMCRLDDASYEVP
jgi:hypothetical protein